MKHLTGILIGLAIALTGALGTATYQLYKAGQASHLHGDAAAAFLNAPVQGVTVQGTDGKERPAVVGDILLFVTKNAAQQIAAQQERARTQTPTTTPNVVTEPATGRSSGPGRGGK